MGRGRTVGGLTGALVGLTALTLPLGGCVGPADLVVGDAASGSRGGPVDGSPAGSVGGAAGTDGTEALQRTDCAGLLRYYQDGAVAVVRAGGLRGPWDMAIPAVGVAEDAAGAAPGASSPSSSASTAAEHSTTTVQEAGLDEPDLVKTDGRVLVTVAAGHVSVVDVTAGQSEGGRRVTTVELPRAGTIQPREVLLTGDRLIVLSDDYPDHGWDLSGLTHRGPAFASERTVVTTVDLGDASAPRVVGSVRLEGRYRSARLSEGRVRLVMVSQPTGVQVAYPRDGSMADERATQERTVGLLRSTTIDDWVPHVEQLDAVGEVVRSRPLLGCEQIARPRTPSALSTLSVATLDPTTGELAAGGATGLVASGETVYASPDRLVVATSPWDLWRWASVPEQQWGTPANRTELHTFDISGPEPSWVASGSVTGTILGQWALDEQDGVLRVATTGRQPQADGAGGSGAVAAQGTSSSLLVLREEGKRLVETGRVDGMGLTEQVRAVRYLSPTLAAVVTFRQTDPLYLVDTSDPRAPRVRGALKIPGYSGYLHPVGDGWLLGIGQDADPTTGRTRGLQASLFDIRDLDHPRRTRVVTWQDTSSPAEEDHRAFTLWPATGQVFLPAMHWEAGYAGSRPEVTSLQVGEGRLERGATADLDPRGRGWAGTSALRTVVVGRDLWVLEPDRLERVDLATLTPQEEISLG